MSNPYVGRRVAFAAVAIGFMLFPMTVPAQDAAPAKPPATGTPAYQDDTSISVIAHRRYTLQSAQAELAGSDPRFACAYTHAYSAKGYKRALTPPPSQLNITQDGYFSSAVNDMWRENQLNAWARDGGRGQEEFCNNLARNTRSNGRGQILLNDKDMSEAFKAYEAKDYAKALPLFEAAYDKLGIVTENNPSAVQRVEGLPVLALMAGRMYLYGQGTPANVTKAIEWFRKAALQDHSPLQPGSDHYNDPGYMSSEAEAAMLLAGIYESGSGDIAADPKEARRWYMRASDLEYVPAAHICGLIFMSGYGGDADISKAVDYFTRAGKANYAPSQYTLGELYYLGENGITQDKTLAGAWLLKAAKGGYPDALYAVARMYDLGEGGATADPQKALIYYKEAAVKGQPDAEEAIGLSFYTGNGLPKDLPTARQWFLKASENANVDAMFNLAVMMTNGEGGDKDVVKAWVWFRIAIAGGHPKAQAALSELETHMTAEERTRAQDLFQPKTTAN